MEGHSLKLPIAPNYFGGPVKLEWLVVFDQINLVKN